ncbi:hypothetical protein [Streptomyces sp. AHA2]|uniref:hypothetical protein n=1 Tax=Streptomyces sp. AHA2 TaxID=3064526 RepID=UPI002FE18F54
MEIVTWYVKRTYTASCLALLTVGLTAAPAAAGGVLPIGSPAFGTSCANHHTGAQASGSTTRDTGAVNGNLAGLPLGSALNQCGGADATLNPGTSARFTMTFLSGKIDDNVIDPGVAAITPPGNTQAKELRWKWGMVQKQEAATHPLNYVSPLTR